jgi:P27 family predicted phage terminase small subunit
VSAARFSSPFFGEVSFLPAKRKQHTQDRSSSSPRLEVVPLPERTEHPPAPTTFPKLLAASVELWDAIWEEPQAKGFTVADRVVLERWILAYDAWRRAMNAVRRQPVVDGSQGQPVQNPLMAWVASRESEMEKCEKQLGVGLRNRSDLGVSIGQARLTAAQLNAMTEESDGGDEELDAEEAEILEAFEAAD